jgi:hypothetical protein
MLSSVIDSQYSRNHEFIFLTPLKIQVILYLLQVLFLREAQTKKSISCIMEYSSLALHRMTIRCMVLFLKFQKFTKGALHLIFFPFLLVW